MIEFTVFMEPVAKGRPRVTRKGITFTPTKTKNASIEFKQQAEVFAPDEPLEGPLCANIVFKTPFTKTEMKKKDFCYEGKPHIKKADIDNYLKLVLDAMNGIFYKDDSQIWNITATKVYTLKEPRIEIQIIDKNL